MMVALAPTGTVTPAYSGKDVETAFQSFPDGIRDGAFRLRRLIFEAAAKTESVGKIVETLKWGQPAYLTKPRTGTTIRLGHTKAGELAIFTHCQTSVVAEFAEMFPGDFVIDGTRAIHLGQGRDLPLDRLRFFVHRALTYHIQ